MGGKESKDSLQPQLVGATYLWQVEEYSNISLLEPKFSSPFELYGDSYRLELHKDDNLEIKLHQMKSSDLVKKFRCASAFLDHSGIQHCSQKKAVEIGKNMQTVVLLSVPTTVLENEIEDVLLTEVCSIRFKISDMDDFSESSALDTNSDTQTLSSDLGKLYSNQTDCDFEIRTNTDMYFKAHRLVLSARSPVFAAMFRNDTAERLQGIVNVTDTEVPTLAALLRYVYTGEVHGLNSNTATPLITAADKYDLQDLKDTCLEFLLANLTMDNICDAVALAEMCDIPSLKKEVRSFVSENTAEVMTSDKWKTLQDQYPDIVNSLLTTLLISVKDKTI